MSKKHKEKQLFFVEGHDVKSRIQSQMRIR